MKSYIYYTADHKYWDQNFLHISQSISSSFEPILSYVLLCSCLNENLINIPFPIMGSLHILSSLSFVTNFYRNKSKQCLLYKMNLSPKLFEKERKR